MSPILEPIRADPSGEDGPVDFRKIAEAAEETGATVILGPPPFAPDVLRYLDE